MNKSTISMPRPSAVHPRSVPADLFRVRSEHGYLAATCSTKPDAERAIRALDAAGFDRTELVLVSEDHDQVRPYPDGDAVEVPGPVSTSRSAGLAAGSLTGAGAGALTGLALVFLSKAPLHLGLAAAIGAGVGLLLGGAVGRWVATRSRRRPATDYDSVIGDDSLLVGVSLEHPTPSDAARRAARAFAAVGLEPRRLPGERAA